MQLRQRRGGPFRAGLGQLALAVATYTYDTLPAAERAMLPAAEDIAAAIASTPALQGRFAERLLDELAAINPDLRHHRSMRRASSTMHDIRHSKTDAMLVGNVKARFSNGDTVQLDAARILAIIRSLYQEQDRDVTNR